MVFRLRNDATGDRPPKPVRRSGHAFSGSLFCRRKVLFDLLILVWFRFCAANRARRGTRRLTSLAFQTAFVLAAGHRPASRLFVVVGRYPQHLRRDGLCAHSVSQENKRRAAQVGVRSVGNSHPDLHSALHFVCRLCPARYGSEAGCRADQFLERNSQKSSAKQLPADYHRL